MKELWEKEDRQKFTFHYASTLSYRNISALLSFVHLHSTMLLLYRKRMIAEKRYGSIYIPLCFYFIFFAIVNTICVSSIYIPLCFYFIQRFPKKRRRQDTIYIPLCFYFIPKSASKKMQRLMHLHSTMLLLYRSFPLHSHLYPPDLHSTMLLLYPTAGPKIVIRNSHLHSTMLLLYLPGASPCFWYNSAFTFHYASTLSSSADAAKSLYGHLHSTMLLLYRVMMR